MVNDNGVRIVTLEPMRVATVHGFGEEPELKAFPGGLYAVMRCQGVSAIGETWQQLVGWVENSRYRHGNHQWLEEALTPPPTAEEAFVLDLFIPIAE